MVRLDYSLRCRLLSGLLAIFALAGIALFFAISHYAKQAADRAYDSLLTASALAIADQVYVVQGEVTVDLPFASLDMLSMAEGDRVFYRVIAPGGATVTGDEGMPSPPDVDPMGRPDFFDSVFTGETVRFVSIGRFLAEPGVQGWVVVQVGQTRGARERLSNEMVARSLIPLLAFMLITVGLVWMGVDHALRPLDIIESILLRRAPTDLSPIETPVPREVFHLVHAINDFIARLKVSFDTLQTFIAEAAHQIRTPLASLRAEAELAEEEDDPDVRRELVGKIRRNAAITSHLVNQLLSHALVTYRSDRLPPDVTDLRPVLREVTRDAVPAALARGIDVSYDENVSEASVQGDAVSLREAFRNLIDNAIKYSPSGTEVGVRLESRARKKGFRVVIVDQGPGIPDSEHEKVFDRFFRGGSAVEAGSGLGLAIVKRVVDAHGGRISLDNRSGGGLAVCIDFPPARPSRPPARHFREVAE